MMIDIWYIVPRRPRMAAGETSATYMGDSNETPPTASPAKKRAITKAVKVGAQAVQEKCRRTRAPPAAIAFCGHNGPSAVPQ